MMPSTKSLLLSSLFLLSSASTSCHAFQPPQPAAGGKPSLPSSLDASSVGTASTGSATGSTGKSSSPSNRPSARIPSSVDPTLPEQVLLNGIDPVTATTLSAKDLMLLNPLLLQQQQQQQMAASGAVALPPPPTSTVDTSTIDLSQVSNLATPAQAFESLVQKGEYNAAASVPKTLFSSMLGGAYVGMGAMLSLAVAGNSPGLAAADPGLQKFLFGALFPVNLLLALQCGGQLYTGNTANMMAAVCEGRATPTDMARSLGLSWMGNLLGCVGFAVACKYAGVLEGGAGHLAAMTLATKTSYELGPLMVKAMFCNWLVCLAVFLSMQAKDMTGKYLSVWLPVSTFVSIGFEHSVANMFLLPAG
eukprot:CAMPEP_0172455516 /NCGR_PEP_ID=MMETSP1065-20121228/12105_1 /TAXON_ID=265537 /ORGANISM="Amphiprora paludosa, Strain CCMP125" /LENGTH=361 /DNA_ID=CAMNT_0013207977 /DNA_START=515 /DNA_END=1596 /DNA_ORIENTATION=-